MKMHFFLLIWVPYRCPEGDDLRHAEPGTVLRENRAKVAAIFKIRTSGGGCKIRIISFYFPDISIPDGIKGAKTS
jgi:hypothetical protein